MPHWGIFSEKQKYVCLKSSQNKLERSTRVAEWPLQAAQHASQVGTCAGGLFRYPVSHPTDTRHPLSLSRPHSVLLCGSDYHVSHFSCRYNKIPDKSHLRWFISIPRRGHSQSIMAGKSWQWGQVATGPVISVARKQRDECWCSPGCLHLFCLDSSLNDPAPT